MRPIQHNAHLEREAKRLSLGVPIGILGWNIVHCIYDHDHSSTNYRDRGGRSHRLMNKDCDLSLRFGSSMQFCLSGKFTAPRLDLIEGPRRIIRSR